MKTAISTLVVVVVAATAATAADPGRGVMAPDPPIEPSSLFTIPTGQVVRSMDLAVAASGVLFGENGSSPQGSVSLGLGDIAQFDMGTMAVASNLDGAGGLVSVPTAGLKVCVPLWKYAHGVAASFHRSGTYEERASGTDYEAKLGEFHAVASLANYAATEGEDAPGAGWNGMKVKAHAGLAYLDAELTGGGKQARMGVWRPVGGVEVWKDDARARVVGELSWAAELQADPDPEVGVALEPIRVLAGGVRFFFSKHATLDIGIRHQSNYSGIAESAIQTRLHFCVPTHILRERVVGR